MQPALNPFRVLFMKTSELFAQLKANLPRRAVRFALVAACGLLATSGSQTHAQSSPVMAPQLVILDTDIGDDIDDAFALALVIKSPELKVLGITTAFGDTELRARLVDRYLTSVGRTEIPVFAGVSAPSTNAFTQAAYARQEPKRAYVSGVSFLLDQIRLHPGEITLIAIGPLTNVEAAIQQEPETFRKLKRVVMMGGSIYRGYGDGKPGEKSPPMRSGTSIAIRLACGRCWLPAFRSS